jgi:hypothetical protein
VSSKDVEEHSLGMRLVVIGLLVQDAPQVDRHADVIGRALLEHHLAACIGRANVGSLRCGERHVRPELGNA